MSKILVLHGPNLNLLGTREPTHYGTAKLSEINQKLIDLASQQGVVVECHQSNAEYELVEWIQDAGRDDVEFIIINPAAFTHTSVAIRDALSAVKIPFIEVHLSNVFGRESFRHHSYVSDIALGVISGLGSRGYEYALSSAISFVSENA